jgi:lipoprotein-anchoring transpeptidase ErfK/SrfK
MSPMRISLVVLVLAFAGLLAVDLAPSSTPHAAVVVPTRALAAAKPTAETVEVAFVRSGWIVRVERLVPKRMSPAAAALRELTQGPTRAERRRGIRTALPDRARLRSLRTDGETWFASFSRSTLGSGSAETKRTRLWQIAATLAFQGDQELVSLAAEGRFVTTARLGVRPGRWSAEAGENAYPYVVRGVQRRLVALGYLEAAEVMGSLDYLTEQALMAFQGWEDLDRTGTVTGQTQVELFKASRPRPAARRTGRRIEIYRDRGVLLMAENGEVVRAVHTSTGSLGRTPAGDFNVYVKSLYSWSVPFHVWMPYAAYFRGGIAMHQSPDVPSYPASHGCVRLPEGEADRVYRFVDLGTPVAVR